MKPRTLFCIIVATTIILCFFVIQTGIVFRIIEPSYKLALFGYGCVLVFIPPFIFIASDLWKAYNESKAQAETDYAELVRTNKYLEHAAKILRHDMHSGINIYLPRGLHSVKRRLTEQAIKDLRLAAPLKLLEEGLDHTQRVYQGVKHFTNLVKPNAIIEKEPQDLAEILSKYLKSTSYADRIALDWLPTVEVNKALFCTAIDNLIRNGLKYNDSEFKMVAITMLDNDTLGVIDNGRGMSQEDFEQLSKPYTRKENQAEGGTGLGLNITLAILKEHNFKVSSSLNAEGGTTIRIKIR